jgi:hypothetical protein
LAASRFVGLSATDIVIRSNGFHFSGNQELARHTQRPMTGSKASDLLSNIKQLKRPLLGAWELTPALLVCFSLKTLFSFTQPIQAGTLSGTS